MIVILAILAALLVPALVGWIDKAREKSYAVEARSIYLAAQTITSENYGSGTSQYLGASVGSSETAKIEELTKLSGVSVIEVASITYKTGTEEVEKNTIIGMEVKFKSSNDQKEVTMVLNGGNWTKN